MADVKTPMPETPVNDVSHNEQPSDSPPRYEPSEPDFEPTSAPATKRTMGERFHGLSSKAGWPLNKAANIIGAEGWWPDTVEKESMKAARILYSFTKLGVDSPPKTNGPKHPTGISRKSTVKIPREVLQNCAGLAIFNTIRAGAWHGSLSGGSGVVIARRSDGTWSPPSSFVVSRLGGGFVFGLDVCDCVCVLNTQAQVDAFMRPQLSLGGGADIAVGPVGTGGAVNAAITKAAKPMWSYTKGHGLWLGIQIDGTIVVTRNDANSVFYNQRGITAKTILTGDVAWPMGAKPLFEILRAMEGHKDIDHSLVREVNSTPIPSDVAPPLNEKASPLPEYTEVSEESAREAIQEKDERDQDAHDQASDLYENSVKDEKERLAKSGY